MSPCFSVWHGLGEHGKTMYVTRATGKNVKVCALRVDYTGVFVHAFSALGSGFCVFSRFSPWNRHQKSGIRFRAQKTCPKNTLVIDPFKNAQKSWEPRLSLKSDFIYLQQNGKRPRNTRAHPVHVSPAGTSRRFQHRRSQLQQVAATQRDDPVAGTLGVRCAPRDGEKEEERRRRGHLSHPGWQK